MFRRSRRWKVCGSMKSAVPSQLLLATRTSRVGWAASAVGAAAVAASAATSTTMRCIPRAPTKANRIYAQRTGKAQVVVDVGPRRHVRAAVIARNFSAHPRFLGAMLRRLAAVALGLVLAAAVVPAAGAAPPNVVFVLTDDLAWNLVQYM